MEKHRNIAIGSHEKGKDETEPIDKMAAKVRLTLQNQDILKKETINRSFYGFWKV